MKEKDLRVFFLCT